MTLSPSVCNDFQTVLLASNDPHPPGFGLMDAKHRNPLLPAPAVPELDIPRALTVYDGLLWIVCAAGTFGCYHLTGELSASTVVTTATGSLEELVAIVNSPPGWYVQRGPIRTTADLLLVSSRGHVYGVALALGIEPLPIHDLGPCPVHIMDATPNTSGQLLLVDWESGTIFTLFSDGLVEGGVDSRVYQDMDSSDPIPPSFIPFSLSVIGEELIIGYAQRGDLGYPQAGPGHGYLSLFDLNRPGPRFIRRLVSRGPLDSPSSVTLAPPHFGYPAGSLLVANWGSGLILVVDALGTMIEYISDRGQVPVCVGTVSEIVRHGRAVYLLATRDGLRLSTLSCLIAGRLD